MKRVSASDAKNKFGGLLEEAVISGGVEIVRHGRVVGILLSPTTYDELLRSSRRAAGAQWAANHMIAPEKARAAKVIRPPGNFDE